jgi:HptB-dependent secretion and biofilm anti anti-sigma factor
MAVKKIVSESGRSVTLVLDERFDFALHQLFREAYITCEEPKTLFSVDLSKTTYMDSSALGMILLLKDHAERLSGTVKIKKPSDSVNKILEIAQFHRLMAIER